MMTLQQTEHMARMSHKDDVNAAGNDERNVITGSCCINNPDPQDEAIWVF
jgi:hypothetical protein